MWGVPYRVPDTESSMFMGIHFIMFIGTLPLVKFMFVKLLIFMLNSFYSVVTAYISVVSISKYLPLWFVAPGPDLHLKCSEWVRNSELVERRGQGMGAAPLWVLNLYQGRNSDWS